VVDGDQVIVTVTNAKFNNKHVGTGKPVTANVSISNGNYRLTAATAATTASITAKDLTIGITAADKVYDGTTEATITGRSLSGAVAGDDVSLSGGTASFASKSVGNGKTVTGTEFGLSGAKASNYSIASISTTTANITAKALTITGASPNAAANRPGSIVAEVMTSLRSGRRGSRWRR